ncbi:NUDIX domain-containing protein [Rhodococcus qingshengii]|uniref:NUDIX domain-containing protein n=1 Tax=Rhodococcus qingshengii TaxID=334542 RepID=UPI0039C1EF92
MSTGGPSESIRRSARALIVDHSYRILLCKFRSRSDETYWITPGGRCEERETPRGTLERELREEVGLELRTTQPLVWRQTIMIQSTFPDSAASTTSISWFEFMNSNHEGH